MNVIERYMDEEKWTRARAVIRRGLAANPECHWHLTQLATTYYEQRRYDTALRWYRKAAAVAPECPLARWGLAGALDAVGQHDEAIQLYEGLIAENARPADEPCWESASWAAHLKADCLFRLGECHRNKGDMRQAAALFRKYLAGFRLYGDGNYPLGEVEQALRDVTAE